MRHTKGNPFLKYCVVCLMACCAMSVSALATEAMSSFTLNEASIDSVHRAMQQHQLTCVALVNDYLTRIKTYDLDLSRGAPINAIVTVGYHFDAAK